MSVYIQQKGVLLALILVLLASNTAIFSGRKGNRVKSGSALQSKKCVTPKAAFELGAFKLELGDIVVPHGNQDLKGALVSAANKDLLFSYSKGEGIARAIRVATEKNKRSVLLDDQTIKDNKILDVGKAITTSAYGIPCYSNIIHVVGPDCRKDAPESERVGWQALLKTAYSNVFDQALQNNIQRVVCAPLSMGNFACSQDNLSIAATIAISQAREASRNSIIKEVVFVFLKRDPIYTAFENALKKAPAVPVTPPPMLPLSEADKDAAKALSDAAKNELKKAWNKGTKQFAFIDQKFVDNYSNLDDESKKGFFDYFSKKTPKKISAWDYEIPVEKFANEVVRQNFINTLKYYGPSAQEVVFKRLLQEVPLAEGASPAIHKPEIPTPPPLPTMQVPGAKKQKFGEATMVTPAEVLKAADVKVADLQNMLDKAVITSPEQPRVAGKPSAGQDRKPIETTSNNPAKLEEQIVQPVKNQKPIAVQAPEPVAPQVSAPGDLLSQIQRGKKLKSVGKQELPSDQLQTLTAAEKQKEALERAMAARRGVIEPEENEEDTGEWD